MPLSSGPRWRSASFIRPTVPARGLSSNFEILKIPEMLHIGKTIHRLRRLRRQRESGSRSSRQEQLTAVRGNTTPSIISSFLLLPGAPAPDSLCQRNLRNLRIMSGRETVPLAVVADNGELYSLLHIDVVPALTIFAIPVRHQANGRCLRPPLPYCLDLPLARPPGA